MKRETENKMRRLFCGGAWAVALMLCGTLSMLTFTACSDDDDDSGSAEDLVESSYIRGTDGEVYHLVGIGKSSKPYYYYSYDYDDEGYLEGFSDNYEWDFDFEVTSYSPFAFSTGDSYEQSSFNSISINGSGYITKFTATYTEEDDDYEEKLTLSCSYSGGHLTKISGSGKVAYDGYSMSETMTVTLSWSGDYLTQYHYYAKGSGSGYTAWIDETVKYDYDEKEYYNAAMQYTPNIFESTMLPEVAYIFPTPLMYIGYFGQGPAYLPEAYSYEGEEYEKEEDDEDDDEYSDEGSYSYVFNSNGTVKSAGGYYFTYEEFENDTDDDEYAAFRISLAEEENPETERERRTLRSMFQEYLQKRLTK